MRLLVVAALTVGFVASCVKDDGSVFIQGSVPVEAPDCNAEGGSDIFVASGRLDVLQPRGFNAALQVVTNLPSTFNNTDVTRGEAQSPNYVDYGSTDNNIIILESAEIDFEFQVPGDNVADVEAVQLDGNPVFNCTGTTCVANGQAPKVSGTVFNEQTTLSSSAAVLVEVISATDAVFFDEALTEVLAFPDNRTRVVANIRLKGTTTGNGELRPITTFTFPFPIDLCRGCLTPDQAFCAVNAADAVVVPPVAEGKRCFQGQDENQVAFCRCRSDQSQLGGAACAP